jgi:hypothetical protein
MFSIDCFAAGVDFMTYTGEPTVIKVEGEELTIILDGPAEAGVEVTVYELGSMEPIETGMTDDNGTFTSTHTYVEGQVYTVVSEHDTYKYIPKAVVFQYN